MATCSLSVRYQQYLDDKCRIATEKSMFNDTKHSKLSTIGIIGGGMTGLYSTLLLQKYIPEARVTVLEASHQVGGSVYTHHFSSERHQYFEAGAMRFPDTEMYKPVFQLVDYLNDPDLQLKLIEFYNSCPKGNRVFVNNTKQKDGRIMSVEYAHGHGTELGFPAEAVATDGDEASRLLSDALVPVVQALQNDFETVLEKYSEMSLYNYLAKEMKWGHEKICYVELLATWPCNSFQQCGLIDTIFRSYNATTWKTIEGGMSRLPQACAKAIKMNGGSILLNALVKSIIQDKEGKCVEVGYVKPATDGLTYQKFDTVVITIPPPKVCNIPKRPHWGFELERALRACYFVPASKMGLRFKSRFWERSDMQHPPSHGGRSLTDLPIKWVMYPDYGIGEMGKGVLYSYHKDDDAKRWMLMSKVERIEIALSNLQLLYPEVNIAQEYAGGVDQSSQKFEEEAFVHDFAFAIILYLPGQFHTFYPTLVMPRGRIYFAGSYLSNSMWMVGALESSRRVVQQVLWKERQEDTTVNYL